MGPIKINFIYKKGTNNYNSARQPKDYLDTK